MVFSELACVVSRDQATDELFSVIGQIAPPHTPTERKNYEARTTKIKLQITAPDRSGETSSQKLFLVVTSAKG
jgi:hypothetical protein